MGTDWWRMTVRSEVPRDVLEDLIERQSAHYRTPWFMIRSMFWHLDPAFGHPLDDLEGERPPTPDPDPHTLLSDCVDYVYEGQESTRVNFVASNPLLPAEWRYEMYRTYLPDQIPSAVARWRAHLGEVKAGQHHRYLRAWHRYEYEYELAGFWRDLADLARYFHERRDRPEKKFEHRPEFARVRDAILALPEPPISPPPFWGQDIPPPLPDDLSYDLRFELSQTWQQVVPGYSKRDNWYNGVYRQPFDTWVQRNLDDQVLWDTLDWLEDGASVGLGVILDW